eukprot:scaffold51810_cov25-Tisochrysis_lutea.AAC.1
MQNGSVTLERFTLDKAEGEEHFDASRVPCHRMLEVLVKQPNRTKMPILGMSYGVGGKEM